MRKILAVSALVMATLPSLAQTEELEAQAVYVNGSYTNVGTCYGNDYWCIDRIKDGARQNALQDASWHCQMQHGTLDQFSAYYSDFCNPSMLPPGNNSTFVSCRSDVQARCQIPDQHNLEETE
jgi:hypothetical protein